MRLVAGRGAVVEKLAGALMRVVGVFLADMQLPYAPWRRSIGKRLLASECKIGKRVRGWQGDARWEMRCTAGKEMHDGQAPQRQGSRWHIGLRAVARYFCLGGALRGYILSITSMGTPRIRCSCLFVAE